MPYNKRNTSRQKKFYRTNQYIKSPNLRVIDAQGEQIGVISKEEALKLAQKDGLDLIEIAPMAKPPVAKIADFKKFKYQEDKKLASQAKKAKVGALKEVRLTPFMAEGDLQVRIKKITGFLSDKHKVRVAVRFTRRQMRSRDQGYKLLNTVMATLGDKAKMDQKPKFAGQQLVMTITAGASTSKKPLPKNTDENAKTKD